MLKGKIHRATVTDSNLDYEGSVAIDSLLMEASGLQEFEQVHIYNIANGNRFTTYVITAPEGTGTISINGAAAHKASTGDLVIIASYSVLDESELSSYAPKLVYVDGANSIKEISGHLAATAGSI
jgi:aspartate 1-decarboxylase